MSATAYIVNERKLNGLLAVKGISKSEFCRQAGIKRTTLADMLTHKHEPSMPTVRRLLDYWGDAATFDDFFLPNPGVELSELKGAA
jgi:transcriptional regulator with XRE-family HTH domain